MDLREIINPKATAARRLREAELAAMLQGSAGSSMTPAEAQQMQAQPMNPRAMAGSSMTPGEMSQSQFMKARTPEERMMQQQALMQKLRSLGQ